MFINIRVNDKFTMKMDVQDFYVKIKMKNKKHS